ncbi:hypothetical protein AAFN86_20160 [Roseomonas sp. CAU 1739]|uniref:hypothetical protein n=1 Tax=Roseomonas sp. CAU 1739 TaxID=3140364 RepID=UPI00325B9AF7
MLTSRFAAVALAAGFVVTPAIADEYATFRQLDIASIAAPDCRTGVLLTLPSAWRPGDGAVVLLTPEPQRDAARDGLVAALLGERAAVLELVPRSCEAVRAGRDTVVAAALGALDALTRLAGAGPVTLIGYGRGGMAVLDVVREPAADLLGEAGPRYVAAVAIGDGAPRFAFGSRPAARREASSRLSTLCQALAVSAGGMGATPDSAAPNAAAESCQSAMAGETSLATVTGR